MESKILHGDCLLLMAELPDKCIDMILCDLPYGTTACEWDTIIPFADLWKQYERIIKDNGAIVLTASQPFTSELVMSNRKLFRYEWIWEKDNSSNFQLVKYQPLKRHESALVFYKKMPTYNPQGVISKKTVRSNKGKAGNLGHLTSEKKRDEYISEFENYPNSIIFFNREVGIHPTQKPVPLFEYLVRTYTDEGDLVLDNCAGSFTTAIACINSNRRYICMEQDEKYFKMGQERIDMHTKPTHKNNDNFF